MIEYLPLVLTGICIIVSILYYTSVLKNTNKTRQAQLLNSIYQTLNEKELFAIPWELELDWNYRNFDDFMQKYGPDTNREAYMRFHRLLMYYEGIGIYIKRGFVSAEVIDDFISGDIIHIWEKYEPFMVEFRKRRNSPVAFEHFEYLYNQIKPIRDKQHPEPSN